MIKTARIQVFTFVLLITALFSCSEDDSVMQTEEQTLARISINNVTQIAGDVANSGASILDDGNSSITKKGICWSKTPNPDSSDFTTNDGNGSTSYQSLMENLDFNTVYYVRAYAENIVGIVYSDEISFTTTNICTLNLFEGDTVRLTNQTEVAAFGANNYCGITRGLVIEEVPGEQDPIVDLSPLLNLRTAFSLYISETSSLQSLEGLNNLSVIHDYMNVSGNNALLNIDALSNVTSEFSQIDVSRNPVLTTIDGLSGITTLVEPDYNDVTGIYIGLNPQLQNIDGLSNINIDGDRGAIGISGNEFITNLDALSGITGEVEFLSLSNMPNLQSTAGISQITSVSEDVFINGLGVSTNWDGFQNITTVGTKFSISFNEGLNNLDAFSNLTSLDAVFVSYNQSLTDYCGLSSAFDAGNVSSLFTENNAYNPSLTDMENGDCAL